MTKQPKPKSESVPELDTTQTYLSLERDREPNSEQYSIRVYRVCIGKPNEVIAQFHTMQIDDKYNRILAAGNIYRRMVLKEDHE